MASSLSDNLRYAVSKKYWVNDDFYDVRRLHLAADEAALLVEWTKAECGERIVNMNRRLSALLSTRVIVISIASMILIGIVYLKTRDQDPVDGPYEGVQAFGPVTQAEFRSSDDATPSWRNTTQVFFRDSPPMTFCGNVGGEIEVGKSYRLNLRLIRHEVEVKDGVEEGSCYRVHGVEQIDGSVQVAKVSGQLKSVKASGTLNYALAVTMSTPLGEQKYRFCNQEGRNGPSMGDSLKGMIPSSSSRSSAEAETLVYYNKADHSAQYDCYPIFVVRDIASKQFIPSSNLWRYFGTGPEGAKRMMALGGPLVTDQVPITIPKPAHVADPQPVPQSTPPSVEPMNLSPAPKTVQTSAGLLELVDASPDVIRISTVKLNGKKIIESEGMGIDIVYGDSRERPTLVVLRMNDGTAACPAHYQLLDLRTNNPPFMQEFGECAGDEPKIRMTSGILQIDLEWRDGTKSQYTYTTPSGATRGVLLQDGKAPKKITE